jgi:hypothetical protein
MLPPLLTVYVLFFRQVAPPFATREGVDVWKLLKKFDG